MGRSAQLKRGKAKTKKKRSSAALSLAKPAKTASSEKSKPSRTKPAKVSVKAKANDTKPSKRKSVPSGLSVAELLAERLRKRREQEENPDDFDGPPKRSRRGRRPKNISDYSNQNDEPGYGSDADYRGLEYDTGIRVKKSAEDKGFVAERYDDFEEELNFDS